MKPAYSLLLSALVFAAPTIADEITIDVLSAVVPPPYGNLNVYGPPLPSSFDVVMTFDSLSGASAVSAIPTSQFAQGINFSQLSLQSWSMSADGTVLGSGSGGSVQGQIAPIEPGTAEGGGYFFNIDFSQGANSFDFNGDLFTRPIKVASLANDPVASFLSQAVDWSVELSLASAEWGTLEGEALSAGEGHVIVSIQPSVAVPEPPLLPLMALGLASVLLGAYGRRLKSNTHR